jgi:hypothetical protein
LSLKGNIFTSTRSFESCPSQHLLPRENLIFQIMGKLRHSRNRSNQPAISDAASQSSRLMILDRAAVVHMKMRGLANIVFMGRPFNLHCWERFQPSSSFFCEGMVSVWPWQISAGSVFSPKSVGSLTVIAGASFHIDCTQAFLASQKCGNGPKLNQDIIKYCLEDIALPTASAYAPIGMHDTQSLDSQSSCSPPHRLLAPAAQRTAMQQGSIRFNLCLEVAVLPWSSAAQEPRILSLAGRCVKEGPISAFKKVVGWLQNLITASIA